MNWVYTAAADLHYQKYFSQEPVSLSNRPGRKGDREQCIVKNDPSDF